MSTEEFAALREQLRNEVIEDASTPAELKPILQAITEFKTRPCISRGQTVHTNGPWSNGHEEQCAIVTNVLGEGVAPGSIVNLHVLVDADQPMIATGVPWYPTRKEALDSLLPDRNPVGGPEVCWSHHG